MRWREFEGVCPEIGGPAREWFERDQYLLVGTLKSNGWPRISAVECDFAGPDLAVGMIWRSVKALDLLRDPRVTVHSAPPGKNNTQGDIKLYGRAVEVTEPAEKRRYEAAISARMDWVPAEPYHCFVIEVEQAALLRFGDRGDEHGLWSVRWRAGGETVRGFTPLEV